MNVLLREVRSITHGQNCLNGKDSMVLAIRFYHDSEIPTGFLHT